MEVASRLNQRPEIKSVTLKQADEPARTHWLQWLGQVPSSIVVRVRDTYRMVMCQSEIKRGLGTRHNPDAYFSEFHPFSISLYMSHHPKIISEILKHSRNGDFFCSDQGNRVHPLTQVLQQVFPDLGISSEDILLLCSDAVHKAFRKTLKPALSSDAVNRVKESIDAIIVRRVDEWAELSASQGEINLTDKAHCLSAEVIGKAFLGSDKEDYAEVADAVRVLINYVGKIRNLKAPQKFIFDLIALFTGKSLVDMDEVKTARQVILQECNRLYDDPKENTIISKMKDDACTESQVKAMIFILLVAGQETTASAMSYMFLKAAQSQELQEQFCSGDLQTDSVITEVLRMSTPAAFTGRMVRSRLKCTITLEDNTTVVRHFEPKTFLLADAYHAARKASGMSDEFCPHQWEDNKAPRFLSLPWLPFGAGPHQCPGAGLSTYELSTVFETVLNKYTLSTNQKEDPPMLLMFTAKLKDPVRVTFGKRES